MKKLPLLVLTASSLLLGGCKNNTDHRHSYNTLSFANSDFDLINLSYQYCSTCDYGEFSFPNNSKGSINLKRYNLDNDYEQYDINYFINEITNLYVYSSFEYKQEFGKYVNYYKSVFDDVDMNKDIDVAGKTFPGTDYIYYLDTHSWNVDGKFELSFDAAGRPIKYTRKVYDENLRDYFVARESTITYPTTTTYKIESKARSFSYEELEDQYVESGSINSDGKITSEEYLASYCNSKFDYIYNNNGQLEYSYYYEYDDNVFVKKYRYFHMYDEKGREISCKEEKIVNETTYKFSQEEKYEYDQFDNVTKYELYDYNRETGDIYLKELNINTFNLKADMTSTIHKLYNEDATLDVEMTYKSEMSRDGDKYIVKDYLYNPDTESWEEWIPD